VAPGLSQGLFERFSPSKECQDCFGSIQAPFVNRVCLSFLSEMAGIIAR
jgi:hypothetical protein